MTDTDRDFKARMAAQRAADRDRIAQERTLTAAPRFGDDILFDEQVAIDRLARLAEQVGRNT